MGIMVEPNLFVGEKKAINELKRNREIIIKPADKGNAVVVMNRDQYMWEG